jgi:hypothetical protein
MSTFFDTKKSLTISSMISTVPTSSSFVSFEEKNTPNDEPSFMHLMLMLSLSLIRNLQGPHFLPGFEIRNEFAKESKQSREAKHAYSLSTTL